MKKIFKLLTVAALLVSSIGYPKDMPFRFSVSEGSGSVQFRALGHPSALHVVGKGPGPEGNGTVHMGSVSADFAFSLSSLDTGIAVRDRHMKEKYLEVEKYPKARLVIANLALPNDFSKGAFSFTAAPFSGVLTLHGISAPITGTVDLKWDGASSMNMSSQFTIKLTQFGIQIPSFSGITIADEVQVTVNSQPQIVKGPSGS